MRDASCGMPVMSTQSSLAIQDSQRRRKTHKKSRSGCQNCKFRRVKCGEERPRCKKCIALVVSCDYGAGHRHELESSIEGTLNIDLDPAPSPSSALALTNNLTHTVLAERPTIFPTTDLIRKLSSSELDILERFHSRTILTVGTYQGMPIYRREYLRLASNSPFLLHIVMKLTLMHDRHLAGLDFSEQSNDEAYHWYKGISQFNRVLSQPIRTSDKDALWSTATLLGAISFAAIEARSAAEAWPLGDMSSSDLGWLQMSEGKKHVWKLADPTRTDSVFSDLLPGQNKDFALVSSTELAVTDLPPGFVRLFDLGSKSTSATNPYYPSACLLSHLLSMECNHVTILRFLSFCTAMNPNYKKLLELKEPRALLLLAYWFGSMCHYRQWWMQRRAILQCQAVCMYLERYHGDDPGIQDLLPYPRAMCGLDSSGRPTPLKDVLRLQEFA